MVKRSNALDLNELVEFDLKEGGIKPILKLVAEHSWWVSSKIYQSVQVVYPGTRRKHGAKENRGQVINGIRLWNNEPANHAFWMALGQSADNVKNFTVCHIYERSVWDELHFTNLANLSAFPTCLESLSEWGPVSNSLKYHSFVTYGYKGPDNKEPKKPIQYPAYWRHQADPPREVQGIIIQKLKHQQEQRPQFRGD